MLPVQISISMDLLAIKESKRLFFTQQIVSMIVHIDDTIQYTNYSVVLTLSLDAI